MKVGIWGGILIIHIGSEKKASTATSNQKEIFCQKTVQMLTKHDDIKIDVIVAQKNNVQSRRGAISQEL